MPDAQLPPLVQALLRPDAYPHPTGRIKLLQTHISYVFLAGDFVYKIKKPVDFGFLNFSTLAKRRYYCRREVELNSRLCEDTYLGVLSIKENDGRYAVGGRGKTVEYAVHMRRLPQDRMLDVLIERGEATAEMVRRVAEKLIPFHASAETSPRLARYGDWAIRYNQRENEDQWAPYIGRTITPEQDRILRAYSEAFWKRNADVLQRRVEQLRIRRTHADLRSDAICMTDGVCIFDCVEFNLRISMLDVARDTGFLHMDLLYRGRPDLADAFVARYMELAKDADHREVLNFYACYSACVRGKVENFLLDIPEIPEKDKRAAAKRANRYWQLAVDYARELPPALLVITCGLPGSGKSTVARELSAAVGAEVTSSDVTRKRLAGLKPSQRASGAFREGIYAPDMTDRTYEAMLDEARPKLLAGQSVVLDASFLRRDYRKRAARLAREAGAQFACVLVSVPDEEARRRLDARLAEGADPSDATWEVYRAQKRRFQRPTEVPPERLIEVETARATRAGVREVVRRLREISPLSVP